MANEILPPNIVGSFLQGRQFVQQQRESEQQNQLRAMQLEQAKQAQARDEQFRSALPAYLQGGTNGLAALYAADPERAMQAQSFMTQQNQLAQAQEKANAKKVYDGAQYLLTSDAPKTLLKMQSQGGVKNTFTDLVSQLEANGKSVDELTDDDIRRFAELAMAKAGPLAGITPEFTAPEAGQKDGQDVFFQTDKTSGRARVVPGVSPRPQKPLVDINMGQERQEARTVGEGFGKMYVELQQAGSGAPARLSKLDRMEQLMQGVQTGKLTPAMTQVASIAQSLGITLDEKLGAKQGLEALSNEIALSLRNPSGGAGMPGAMSDKDREFLTSMTPGLAKTPAGNKLIIETARKVAQRDQDVAKLARAYRKTHGSLDEGFYDELADYSASHPLFESAEEKTTVTPDGWIIREKP
jgi:hypothetical protein